MKLDDNYELCLRSIKNENWQKAKRIIAAFPDILTWDNGTSHDTILITALKYLCPDDFLEFLIESGCNVNATGSGKSTPLFCACVYRPFSLNRFDPVKSPRYQILFHAGARMTPFEKLELAGYAEKPDWELMEKLLRDNPSVKQETNDAGKTLLEMYASAENLELFEFYLRTAQWELNETSSPEAGSILGQIWESAYLVNPYDPPKTIKKRKFLKTNIIPKLESMGAKKLLEEKVFEYIVKGDLVVLQEMLQKKPDIINIRYHGETILVAVCDAVCRFGLMEYDSMINCFLRAGADVNSTSANGRNALHWAMMFGNEGLEKKFISLGINVNAKDNKGNTPLHYAMELCNYWPVKLFDTEVDINAMNDDGETPLDWAREGLTPARTRQFRKYLKAMGALSGKELIH